MASDEKEFERCRAALGLAADFTGDALKKAYLQKSYALMRSGATEEERAGLRAAHDALQAELNAIEQRRLAQVRANASVAREELRTAQLVAEVERDAAPDEEAATSPWDPRSFDSHWVNLIAPPLVAGCAILVHSSPLGFLLEGFHVWIHEFGHATVRWLTGYRALPLPFGWTSVAPEKSLFVYLGVLFLLTLLFIAGAKERKIWPMLIALGVALVQAVLTWRMPAERAEMWGVFGGVGGEFYLAAAMMGAFYFRLPEKFRWSVCRYVFLFVGAASFFETFVFWRRVKHGDEGIPYGSMINGEEDAGGDMNRLHDEFGWSQHDIIRVYNHLGDVCLVVVLALFVVFALRLDQIPRRWLERHRADT